uniref:uncharacterized protein LOC122610797 n=1 Tax=Erigeron canadensis TaxID=72917 RepID=UPI001CB9B498|nr:uncharacterized protein LOC122610797 [Erigeron canadensis]
MKLKSSWVVEHNLREILRGQALPVMGFPMGSIATWNIRGLNRPLKQKEVRQVVNENHLNVCAIIESHMDVSKLFDACKKICRNWDWTSNGGLCSKGTRIIVGWNSDLVDVMVLAQSNQVIHTQITYKVDSKSLFCSFVYADNYYKNRRELWQNLGTHKEFVRGKPWIVLGDFNSSLNLEDSYLGTSSVHIGMREFKECVEDIEVMDIKGTSLHYTWNQKPKKGVGILKKIDRVIGNVHFVEDFPASHAIFQPYRVSDHSPCVVKLLSVTRDRPKPFKFANFLVTKNGFREAVNVVWSKQIDGHKMFQVVKKLRELKSPLRKLLFSQGNLQQRVMKLRNDLDAAQQAIDNDPSNMELRGAESKCLKAYEEALLDEKSFLKQKSKIDWLQVGDTNSKYFHNVVKCKNHRSRVERITDVIGVTHEGGAVAVLLHVTIITF